MKKLRFGKAFSDEFAKSSKYFGHFKKSAPNEWGDTFISSRLQYFQTSKLSIWRKLFFILILLISFSALCLRIFHLQIAEGAKNRELSDSNRIQVRVVHAPRGVVYDRNGKILSQNEPGFRVVNESTTSAKKFSYISRDEALKLEINDDPKFSKLEIDSLRSYPYTEKTAHILGYISEITEDELKDPKFNNYKPGDRIGRGGVEQVYEKILKGVDGGEVIEVDAQGKKIRTIREIPSTPGQNLYLTIDAGLQEQAYLKLEEAIKKSKSCCGALVASDPASGQILALASYPSYNPKDISQALSDPNFPMLNRVIGGTYPPGSTYKIASSLAGLESGKITRSTIYEDTGVVQLGPYKFANWYFTQYGRTEGPVDVIKALKRSNDIFYYRLGQATGEQMISDTSKKLGLGKILGIDLPGELPGVMPDDQWKRDNIGEVWFPGDTLHMSIGQGFILSTPLQVLNLISIIATDGEQYPPHLAYKITTPDNQPIKQYRYENVQQNAFKKENIAIIRQGLEEVTKDGGTAWPFFNFPVKTAGKTGTAEFGHPEDKTHAWYTGYAPTQNPLIAATVLIEAGGEGSTDASPVVKEVFRYYFSEDKKNLIKDLTPIIATQSARTLGE